MGTLSFWQWVWLIAVILSMFFVLYHQYKIIEERELAKSKISELRKFYDLVYECDVTKGNKSYIEQRLKQVRADALMETDEYCNLVDEINTCYQHRFSMMGYSFETGV